MAFSQSATIWAFISAVLESSVQAVVKISTVDITRLKSTVMLPEAYFLLFFILIVYPRVEKNRAVSVDHFIFRACKRLLVGAGKREKRREVFVGIIGLLRFSSREKTKKQIRRDKYYNQKD